MLGPATQLPEKLLLAVSWAKRSGLRNSPALMCYNRPRISLLEQHLMIFPHRVLVATFMLGILCAPMAWSQPATMQAGGLPLALF